MTAPFTQESPPGREPSLLPLLSLFFVSGATSLLYEVIWMRRLTLVFGATQLAVATVLAAFMAGLAIGAALGGRVADRRGDLLRIYGVLELGIGLFAIAFPLLMTASTTLYRSTVAAETVHFWSSQAAHLVLMVALLVVPTAAMGATLPLLVRQGAGRLSRVGRRTGLLYGFNTAGAVVGVWVTGFVLLPTLGVRGAELFAAVANIGVGIAALVLAAIDARSSGGGAPVVVDDSRDMDERRVLLDLDPDPDLVGDRRARMVPWVIGVLGVSGACTMIFEVAWSRFLALILGSSVYAFTLMLVAFLLGTAGGALVGSARVAVPGTRPMRWLAASLGLAGLTAMGINHLFPLMPYWYVDLYGLFDGQDSLVLVGHWLLAAIVMTPTTFCIGLAFPFAAAIVADNADAVGRDVSRLYVSNTAGAVIGSLLAGFVLMPRMGIQETLLAAVLVELALAGVVIALRAPPAMRAIPAAGVAGFALVAVLIRPPWDPLLMSAGMYKYVSDLSDYTHEAVRNYAMSDFELLYYAEGTTSTVTVARSVGSGNVWLANNGKVDASSQEDLRTQVLLGHLPFLVKPDAKTALVVGLASGVTTGSVTLQPGLESIDVLEIEPAVIVASHYFDLVNQRPLEDPRVRVIPNDARNHLVLYDGTYDVIVNEPSNPWISGVSNLFTREFLELGRARLAPDGVFCQWLQIYGMGKDDLRSLLRTFADVFPRVSVWYSVTDSDVLMLGSRGSVDVWSGDLAAYFADERGVDLARIEIDDPYDLMTYLRMDRDDLVEAAADVGANTDDNVRIEFSAPRYLHYETAAGNNELLESVASGAWELHRDRFSKQEQATFLVGLAEAYEKRELWYDAASHYLLALERRVEDPELFRALAEARRRLDEAVENDE